MKIVVTYRQSEFQSLVGGVYCAWNQPNRQVWVPVLNLGISNQVSELCFVVIHKAIEMCGVTSCSTSHCLASTGLGCGCRSTEVPALVSVGLTVLGHIIGFVLGFLLLGVIGLVLLADRKSVV